MLSKLELQPKPNWEAIIPFLYQLKSGSFFSLLIANIFAGLEMTKNDEIST